MDQTGRKKMEFPGDGLVIFPEPSQLIKAYKLLQAASIDGNAVGISEVKAFRSSEA